jgi:hypothetical protein
MDEINNPVERMVERIAAPLRAPEKLPNGFEDRLLSRIRAEAIDEALRKKDRPRSWWTAPRTITRAPIMSMVIAAGFAALVALTTLAVAESGPIAGMFAPRADTVHLVRFVYHDSAARHVAVVGDFNRWGASEIQLVMNEAGVWTATVALPPGSHEYAFVVDGGRWVADPSALSARDEFGTPTSRVKLGAPELIASE